MTVYKRLKINVMPLLIALMMLTFGLSSLSFMGQAAAAPFTQAFVRLDRLKATTATGGRVCVKPITVAVEASVQVTFPTTGGTDYIVNGTAANWTVTTTGLDSGQTAWPGIGTATNVTGKVVTFPSTDLTVGTLYCFNFAAASTLTTSSAGAAETVIGNILTRTTTPTNIDQTNYDLSIISDDTVVISAVVPPIFTFVLSGNTDAFTTNLVISAVVNTSGRQVTITTNAATGWIVWVKDLNNSASKGALNSTTATYKIAGAAAVNTGNRAESTEDYGLATTLATDAAGGGTVTINTNTDGTTAGHVGTLDPLNFEPVASANGTANGDIINLYERAYILGSTPAASDYSDTLTVVGAGLF